jgi:hypothetical protein
MIAVVVTPQLRPQVPHRHQTILQLYVCDAALQADAALPWPHLGVSSHVLRVLEPQVAHGLEVVPVDEEEAAHAVAAAALGPRQRVVALRDLRDVPVSKLVVSACSSAASGVALQ